MSGQRSVALESDDEDDDAFDDGGLLASDEATGFKKAFGVSKNENRRAKLARAIRPKHDELGMLLLDLKRLKSPNADKIAALHQQIGQRLAEAPASRDKQEGLKQLRQAGLMLMDTLSVARKEVKATPLKVMVGKPPTEVQVFWTDIPGFDKLTPDEQDEAAQKVAEKIARGNFLVDAIAKKNPFLPTEREDKLRAVTDIAWALKTRAQEKAGPYEKGGLTVPGGEELRKFFDSCGEDIYPRRSTHLGDQQKKPGQSPRGMDFYGGIDTLKETGAGDGLLPMGMNTILMQMVEDTNGNKRMYIKMETASAYGSAGKTNKNDPQGIPGGGRADKVDVGELLSHGANIFRDTDQHKDLKTRREDTPKGLYGECLALIKTFENTTARGELLTALGKKKKKLRINKFVEKLQEWSDNLILNETTEAAIELFMDRLYELYGEEADLAVHAGGEVAL